MNLGRALRAGFVAFKRSLIEAATTSARFDAWANLIAPARQSDAVSSRVAGRAAYSVMSNPFAASLADVDKNSIVPDFPSVRSAHPNDAMRRVLEDQFFIWAMPHLTEFLRNFEFARFTSGEALGLMDIDRRGQLRARQLSNEQLDRTINRELPNGGRIIHGVETDLGDEIVAYHILRDAPDTPFATLIDAPRRVDAADVLHLFDQKWPGQRRGISELTPVMTALHEYQSLLDALRARAKTAALFGGWISDPNGASFADATGKGPNRDLSLEPGVVRVLDPGQTISFPSLPDMADAPALIKQMQRDICAGCGIPFELATGDLSGVNYSSAKVGIEAFRRKVKAFRSALLIPRVLEPIWRRWVLLEILTGRLHAPDFERDPQAYFGVTFLFPEWASLDPLKDAQADQITLATGTRSRAEIVSARGRDITDVDAEIEADTFKPTIQLPSTQGNLDNATA